MSEPTLAEQWTVYERGMAERGSGCTQQQMIGASLALLWVEPEVARLRAENELYAGMKEGVTVRINDLSAENTRLQAECAELRAENVRLRDGHWVWQGDGEDHLESLVCNVLIRPEQLRALLARLQAAEAVLDAISWPRGERSEAHEPGMF